MVLRGCPQAQFFSHKNIKTYLSRPKKGTFGGLPGITKLCSKLFFLCPGVETYLDTKKNIVSNIVSPPPLNYPPSMLAVFLVVVLVVVLLSCCSCCLCLLCCRVANTTAAAIVGMPLPPPPPSGGMEVDACYTNANSSPATSSQIEQWKKSGTKIQHGLRRLPNTNKNATTNQKHASLTGKR